MVKRSPRPLDRDGFEVRFYEGEIVRLKEILPSHVSVTLFIRELVSKALRRIEDKASQERIQNVPDVDISIGTPDSELATD